MHAMRRILLGASLYSLMAGYAAWAMLRWSVSGGSVSAGKKGREAARWQHVSRLQGRGARRMLRLMGWEVSASGSQLPAHVPLLIVANHISALDPWIIASVFDCSFVGKAEIARWPVIGFVGRAAGLILAHRQHKMKTTGMVEAVRRRLACGVPVAIFPEGTTSDGRAVLPFRTGGFAALVDEDGDGDGEGDSGSAGLVLPVYFHITHIDGRLASDEDKAHLTWHGDEEMWPWLWRVMRYRLRWSVRASEPIPAAGHTRKSLAAEAERAVDALRRDAPATPFSAG